MSGITLQLCKNIVALGEMALGLLGLIRSHGMRQASNPTQRSRHPLQPSDLGSELSGLGAETVPIPTQGHSTSSLLSHFCTDLAGFVGAGYWRQETA